jgi:hypothetical protein
MAALGLLVCAIGNTAPGAGADSAATLPDQASVERYFRGFREAASEPAHRTAMLGDIHRRSDASAHVLFGADAAHGLSASVDVSRSDLLARLHHTFGSDLELSSDRARRAEREVLLRNSDALVRAKLRLSLGKGWPGFLYADMGATDSALRWQGLAGIHGSHGVDLVGGWRRITYHFSPGRGFDSLDFNGPFLGATLAW